MWRVGRIWWEETQHSTPSTSYCCHHVVATLELVLFLLFGMHRSYFFRLALVSINNRLRLSTLSWWGTYLCRPGGSLRTCRPISPRRWDGGLLSAVRCTFQGHREHLLTDDLFLTKIVMACVVGSSPMFFILRIHRSPPLDRSLATITAAYIYTQCSVLLKPVRVINSALPCEELYLHFWTVCTKCMLWSKLASPSFWTS